MKDSRRAGQREMSSRFAAQRSQVVFLFGWHGLSRRRLDLSAFSTDIVLFLNSRSTLPLRLSAGSK